MCPLTQCDIVAPSVRRASRKESRAGEESTNIRIQEYGVTAEELCALMQLRGPSLKDKIDDDYGGATGLCIQICTSSTEGLADSPKEMQKRIQHFGPNVIPMKNSKSFFRLMLEALKEPTLIILEVATVVSLALSFWNMFRPGAETSGSSLEWIEGVAIAVGVLVIVLVTAFNDYGKERQFRLLQERVRDEHTISVWRNGKTAMIPVQELVVGDVCQVKYGDVIPADGIVLHSQELTTDESSLTGESDPVKKDSENDCQVLSDTHVVEGSGRILILAVGLNSQTGAIYKLLGAVKKEKKQKKVKEPFSEEKTNGHIVQDESANGSVNIAMEDPKAVKQASDAERKEKNHSVFQSKLNVLAYRIGIIGFIFSAATSLVIIIRFCVENYGIQRRPWKTEDATTIMDSIVVGITILVSAIPEGLPLAVTLTLAFSAKKMMRDNNLVRHLFACETMGCATTICSDKTGTLTTNRMTVTKSWLGGSVHSPVPNPSQIVPFVADIISTAVAVNSSYTSDIVVSEGSCLPEHRGNKTECALLGYTASLGRSYRDIRAKFREDGFVKVYTFNSFRKSMSTVVAIPGGWRVFTKGAAEIVLAKKSESLTSNLSRIANTEDKRDEIHLFTEECYCLLDETGSLFALEPEMIASLSTGVVSAMASEGLRTICIAYKDFILNTANPGYSYPVNVVKVPSKPDFEDEKTIISGLTCLALVGIEDPVRPEVPKAIRRCQRAGITVRMITGDNVETARSIAQKCGITKPDDDSLVLEGKQFNSLIRDENGQIDKVRFDKIWPKLRVMARSTPEDKFTLVDGIINSRASKHREVVAVTGDGTNDGPALRKADVGFAMGIAGTDVAKEASDIILTDDNFISIVKACMWGRNIYDNVAKFLQFQLTVNVAALSVAIISACVIGDTPLKAVPMLWINMIQDTLGSLALATEPPGEALLKRKPYGRKKRIISSIITRNILGQGIYQAVVLLCILFVGPRYFGVYEHRQVGHVVGEPTFLYTMIFNTLVVMTSFNLINARCIHNEVNVFEGIHRNIYFVILWVIMFVTQVLVVQFGGYVFSTQPLPLDAWMVCLFFGVGSLIWYHVLRLIPTRRKRTLSDWLE